MPFILGIAGIGFLLFARKLAALLVASLPPEHKFRKPLYYSLFYVWPVRAIGIMCITFSVLFSLSGPPSGMMNKDKNRLILLGNGEVTEGEVTEIYYQRLAPEGWTVVYKFNAENPATGEEETYLGSAQGPRKYYKSLSAGDPITVIYYPLGPKINCEIRYFLNYPSFRNTFKKAGKLQLLNKFKNQYEIEDYSFKEWFKLQWEK